MNVLLIMQDALRPDRLGCYGYRKDTSPFLDKLAREGVRYETVVSVSSHTFPAVVSLLTCQWTATHNLMSAEDYGRWMAAPPTTGGPLRILRANGWDVEGQGVYRWAPLGFERDAGDVDEYLGRRPERPFFFLAEPYSTHLPYNPPREYYDMFRDPDFHTDAACDRRLEIVRTRMIIHPPGLRSKFEAGQKDTIGGGDTAHQRSAVDVDFEPGDLPGISALYDGEVRVFDDLVRRWFRLLEQSGSVDDTLIAITADHGEELLERGHVGHSSCNLNGTLYDECIRIPLILWCPACLPSGVVVRHQVSQIDILPTILDLLGAPELRGYDGVSTLPLIRGAQANFRREAYAQTLPAGWQALDGDDRQIWCVRTLRWKLIAHTASAGERIYELYDLRTDPGERENVYCRYGGEISDLHAHLDREIERDAEARARAMQPFSSVF